MRKSLSLLSSVMLLAGCSRLLSMVGKDADGGAEASLVGAAAADAGATGSVVTASNVGEIATFGDQQKMDGVAELTGPAIARRAPPAGDVVTTLARGAQVTEMALHEGWVLVTFSNPRGSDTLMGWIPEGVIPGMGGGSGSGGGGGGGGSSGGGGGHMHGGGASDAGVVVVADAGGGGAVVAADAGTSCPAGKIALKAGICAQKCGVPTDCPGGKTCMALPVNGLTNLEKVCIPP